MAHQANEWKAALFWQGIRVKQIDGLRHLIGRTGKVVETFFDEKGALHCKMEKEKETDAPGWFWCPASLLEKE